MDELNNRRQTTASNAYFGQPRQDTSSITSAAQEIEPFELKKRQWDMLEYEHKRQFDNQFPLRQEGVRKAFDPSEMNTVYQPQQEELISPYQRANLALEEKKLEQSGRTGEDRAGLGRERLAFDQQKSDQIYETKNTEAEAKAKAAEDRLAFSEKQLAARQGDQTAILEFRKAQQEATEARQALEIAQRDRTIAEGERRNKTLEDAARQPKTTTQTVSPNRNTRTTETVTGSGGSTVRRLIVPEDEREGLPIRDVRMGDINLTSPTPPIRQSHEEFMAQNDPRRQIQPQTNNNNVAPAGRVRVISPDGKSGTVSEEEAASLPAGWKRQ